MKSYTIAVAIVAALGAGCSNGSPEAGKSQGSRPAAESRPERKEVTMNAGAQRQAALRVEVVRVRSLPQVLRATGRLALNENRTWRVGAVVEGQIVRILANIGDAVKQGQILARMHSHEIHEARAEYRRAVGELSRAKSEEAYATRVRTRSRRLFDLKAASLEQVEHSETELKNAQSTVANAGIEVERTRRHLVEFLQIPADHPEHAPEDVEKDEADLIPIKSPADGIVMARDVTPGTVVQPSGAMFVVSDLSTLWSIAAVAEEHLPKLRTGMPVSVYVQAYGEEPFRGRIGKIGEELDPTTRTVRVRVDVPNRGARLKPEMYATNEIELGQSERAIFVPQEAVQEVGGQSVVFVRRAGDAFELRAVQLGRTMDGEQQIVSGLAEDEAVVTHGSFIVKSQLLKSTISEE